ncbi:linear amide C-N hydrolase [Amantichitinum ursilacus]|uniref:Choloylglycine hydrolase n=1 Tax=Amantichitinum ursilacus TaxID=857265 RepID=A0A0N0GQD4_9NEIS|nr:choloylglycine hydrolase family protein [Amantichitinum ursilacus]KPC54580.1 Choloylglycine hydrolase [Amantichitinum ursilacus]
MKRTIRPVAAWLCLAANLTIGLPNIAAACTGITLVAKDGSAIQARTMEWGTFFLDSEIMVVPRQHVFKAATPDGKAGLAWTGKYGIVGLNLVQTPVITDGMNEKGLTVSSLYLPGYEEGQKYDPAKADQTLAMTDVPTWLLSNFATTEEVRKNMPDVIVTDVVLQAFHGIAPPVHFMITDRSGKTIVLEYTHGSLNIYDDPVGVLTNSPEFPWHLTNLRNYVGLHPQSNQTIKVGDLELAPFGAGNGMVGLPGDYTPPSRFVRAAALRNTVRQPDTGYKAVNEAFRILDNFDIPLGATDAKANLPKDETIGSTQWSSAMDTASLRYYYHTMFNRSLRMIDLKKTDFNKREISYFPLDARKEQSIETVMTR